MACSGEAPLPLRKNDTPCFSVETEKQGVFMVLFSFFAVQGSCHKLCAQPYALEQLLVSLF